MSSQSSKKTSSVVFPSLRMHRLASQLASIKISLDPPSPTSSSAAVLQNFSDSSESSSDIHYLQIPTENDFHQVYSPPPDRRGSMASATSDSLTISMSSSYQSLLSPMSAGIKYSIDDYDVLPNDFILRSRSFQGNPSSGEAICVPPVLLSPVLSRPIRSVHSTTTSPLPSHSNAMTLHGSDSENSDSVPWRGSGGSMCVPRRSLASGSRSSTPIMSPIMNRSSSGSRLGALHLMSRSGSGSGLLSGRVLLHRTDSTGDSDRRRKRLRRRTMNYGTMFISRG